MTEFSLYVLDIVNNSITAGAAHIHIALETENGFLRFMVRDNGCGMSSDMLEKVVNPFTTTRTTRKVGLGLPFLKMLAEQTGGALSIESTIGVGTTLTTTFGVDHIDMVPMGDLAGTVVALIQAAPDRRFTIERSLDGKRYHLDTDEMQTMLGGDVPLNEPDVLAWINDYISENEQELNAAP